jgi:predicted transcriptional regulator YheO
MDIVDEMVARLLELVAESSKVQDLEVGREQAREIGEKLNDAGGFSLMRNIAHMARDQGKEQGQPHALGYIERWWDGIGEWRS